MLAAGKASECLRPLESNRICRLFGLWGHGSSRRREQPSRRKTSAVFAPRVDETHDVLTDDRAAAHWNFGAASVFRACDYRRTDPAGDASHMQHRKYPPSGR